MFLSANKIQPTPAKKTIYLTAAIILGIFLSLILHAVIETIYLNWTQANDQAINWYNAFGILSGGCALHPLVQWLLLIIGAIGGFYLGKLWWRYVYIDKVWAKGKLAPKQEKNIN